MYHILPFYEQIYCARGEMENRIKEQQLDLIHCPLGNAAPLKKQTPKKPPGLSAGV